MNGNVDQIGDQVAHRLVELLSLCFGAAGCVEGLEQQLDEATRLVGAVSPVCGPEALVRVVAGLEIWTVRARADGEWWDFREEGLESWLSARPSARVWVTGEEVDREPIARWLMDRLGDGHG